MKLFVILLLTFAQCLANQSTEQSLAQTSIIPADTAWMMVSSAFVLMMSLPGIALFYAGMTRKKNILSVIMLNFGAISVASVLWIACGYSIAFGGENAFFGDFSKAFLSSLAVDMSSLAAPNIPESVYIMFQMTFAMISCAIITGSVVERVRFVPFMLFIALWLVVVYAPTAHWVWSPVGFLANDGVLDYAGGTVVHINAGIAGLVGSLVLGARVGYKKEAMPPHNLVLTMLGISLLWVGWIGFNAGSALGANAQAGMVLLVTHASAASGAITWLVCERIFSQKPSALGFCSGALCGLVAITPAAGYVSTLSAMFLACITCVCCFYFVAILKPKLRLDDSLDAFGIHAIGGAISGVLVAFFAKEGVEASLEAQVIGVLVTIVYSGVLSWVLFFVIDKLFTLRASSTDERIGLDISEHSERLC